MKQPSIIIQIKLDSEAEIIPIYFKDQIIIWQSDHAKGTKSVCAAFTIYSHFS